MLGNGKGKTFLDAFVEGKLGDVCKSVCSVNVVS